ncbi:hypothetical protein [Aureibaculum luteum]|uniref:hypothetical protein n=1 Tax=Aureibaculum luteum TaxID=1548456 RepID=UPI000E4FA81E|nr:hypothetical protein [Aureibaculum luteum]
MNILKGFYAFAIGSGLFTIYNNLDNLVDPTIAVSILGIVSGILFFIRKYEFYYLALIWIIIQIPYFVINDTSINLSLLYSAKFGLTFGSSEIGVNIHVFLLFFAKYLILSQYLEKEISVKPFTEKSTELIGDGITFKTIDIISNKSLSSDINLSLNGIDYSKLYFQPQDSDKIKKGTVFLIPTTGGNELKASIIFEKK